MTRNPFYPHLFSPINVGGHELANRIMMGSMHTNMEEKGADGLRRLAAFYAERARGGCALMVTGGFSPNAEGRLGGDAGYLVEADATLHRIVPETVHAEGGRILLQLIHSGRYGYHGDIVAPSAIRAPINKTTPRAMSEDDIARTIADYARAAQIAEAAGYDGVEIMGSEGYLVNEFTAPRTNRRGDRWGGDFANRVRFPVEVVRAVRAATHDRFIVMYRISVLDLVDGGCPPDEVVALARAIEAAGADILNTGIGWHEVPIPTIAQAVPRGGWAWAAARLMGHVNVPVISSNRFNMPDVAESVIAAGDADMVSMARPFLADENFVAKAEAGRADEINTCIACNQACLDHYFQHKEATCLVNPRAGRETELNWVKAERTGTVAVVGAGVAGLSAAAVAGERGHAVTVFEAGDRIGGQFLLARQIPGKQEFDETLRYFTNRLKTCGVKVRLATRPTAENLRAFDEIVVATGVAPRLPDIDGIDHPMVMTYADLLSGAREPGRRVAVVGAGGIGVDVSVYLVEKGHGSHLDTEAFARTWGVECDAEALPPGHEVTLLQRSEGRMGSGPGKTTGWVHRLSLLRANVEMLAGVTYNRIDDAGLHITIGGEDRLIGCDSIVICAGQTSVDDVSENLREIGKPVHVIGGARLAGELDAQRAIEEGTRVAAGI